MSPTGSEFITLTGPLFIGAIMVWMLMGSIVIQLYDYHNTSRSTDRAAIKALVYFVFLVESLQTIMITHTCWFMLIANWGDPTDLINTPWSSAAISVLNGVVAAAVQCFFSWRIWQLTYSAVGRAIAMGIVLIALIQLGAAATMTADYIIIARDTFKLTQLVAVADTWLISSLIGDTVIAVSMVVVLSRAKNKSSFARTETLLNRLIIATIETGVVTAGLALITLVLFKVFPTAYYFLTTEFVMGKMYATVLLAALNGRNRSRNMPVTSNFGTVNQENFNTEMNALGSRNAGASRTKTNSMGVVLSTTVDTVMGKEDADGIYSKGTMVF